MKNAVILLFPIVVAIPSALAIIRLETLLMVIPIN